MKPVRAENENDWDAVRAVNLSAFETAAEGDLVDALRARARPVVSLVAEDDGGVVVGHIMFSPVTLSGHDDVEGLGLEGMRRDVPEVKVMGLAPMAVVPEHQRKGIGSALVRAGLEWCKELGFGAVVVLGHPEYYPRFGFSPSSRFGIKCEYEVPEDVFMVMELRDGALGGRAGTVTYHAAFGDL